MLSLLRNSELHSRPKPPPWGILHTINREQGFYPAQESGKKPYAGLKYHSPLEGESARGRSPSSSRWGANAASRESTPRSRSGGGRLPVPMSLPGREEGDGRIVGNAGAGPLRISLRH